MAATTPTTGRGAPARPLRAQRWAGPGMLAPFVLFYLLFLIGPALYNLVASFFNASLLKGGLGDWVGLTNYADALGSSDFWRTLWHTVWFTILTTIPLVVLSLALALLADRFVRGRWFFRLAFFAPFVLPSAVIAMIWMWIYADQIGLAQEVVSWFGATSPSWLGDPDWAMLSIAVATIWWTIGFNFVLYLAGLQDIPRDVHEAAAIDGAGPWQRIRHIVIPMLGRTTTLVAVLQLIASLKVFDQIYIMTGASGGPEDSTRPTLEYIYDTGFTDGRVGYASTVSLLLFVIILLVSLVWFALVRRAEKDR